MVKEILNQGDPEMEIERKRNRMHIALVYLQKLLEGIDATPEIVVNLNKNFDHESMGFYWQWADEPKTQGAKLDSLVKGIEKDKGDINLLSAEEKESMNQLLIRAKIYLSYYEKDLKKK